MELNARNSIENYELARSEELIDQFLRRLADNNHVFYQFILHSLKDIDEIDVSQIMRRVFALILNLVKIPNFSFAEIADVYNLLEQYKEQQQQFKNEFDKDNSNLSLSIAIAVKANSDGVGRLEARKVYGLMLDVLFVIHMIEHDFLE